jgi:DNA-binding response OmpR family regulator
VTAAATLLIAVGDGVLADSLRFSLELEGYAVMFCDEHSLVRTIAGSRTPHCLVLDQDVFARMVAGKGDCRFDGFGVPVILMAGNTTRHVLTRAAAAGVTKVVEKPLLGEELLDAIRTELRRWPAGRRDGAHGMPRLS